jgi:hypothetical protein
VVATWFIPGPTAELKLYMRGRLRLPGGGGGSRDVQLACGGGVRGSESIEKEGRSDDGVDMPTPLTPSGAGDAGLLSSGVFNASCLSSSSTCCSISMALSMPSGSLSTILVKT